MKNAGGAILVTLLALAVGPASALGQSRLERVEELARLGRADEARAVLVEWWEGDRERSSRDDQQRGLWLRGRLTVDPVQAELDFQRLVVLYPSGVFTADALLRLAQSSYALGNETAARDYISTLRRDHPRSGAVQRADAWLAVAGPVPPPGDIPTRATGEIRPTGSRSNQVAADTARGASSPPPRPTDAAAPPAADAAALNYSVQLGAFADEERAFSLYEEVRAAGVDVRLVRVEGSRFTHVRVGRFAERPAAVELLDELTARGISAALVRDDRVERPIRR